MPTSSGVNTAALVQPREVDSSTADGKLLFGYQGWFACPEDGSGLRWQHWFRDGSAPSPASLLVDMWPDVAELPPASRCRTSLTLPGGGAADVYSSLDGQVVDLHFRWLRDYDLPGVFLQRFTSRLDDRRVAAFRDGVAGNVRAAAERHGRVFALMYDITGHRPATLVADVQQDWMRMVDALQITASPRYLHHGGRPLLGIWGLGFGDRPASAPQAAALLDFFRHHPEPRYRASVWAGVPTGWRTLTGDAAPDPAWAQVYRSVDVLSPWTVGRFRDDDGAARHYRDVVTPDMEDAAGAGVGYAPVLFPGFSWHNLQRDAALNQIPRRAGRFFWTQVERALELRATMLYAAMFDEVDEGTAMFKVATRPDAAPSGAALVTLDADGVPVPNDWYLRLAREAQLKLDRGGARPGPPRATGSPSSEATRSRRPPS